MRRLTLLIAAPLVIAGLVGYSHFALPNYGRGVCYAGCPTGLGLTELDKQWFKIGYDEQHRSPAWVCYRLGPILDDHESQRRPGWFATDHDTTARVTHDQYTDSGYDRGHMAPLFGIASRFGPEAGRSTFVMSNVCPQLHGFNAGLWGQLEALIAGSFRGGAFHPGWADRYDRVWVIVGPILPITTYSRGRAGNTAQADVDRSKLAESAAGVCGVDIAPAFFALIVDEDGRTPRVLAFALPHLEHDDNTLRDYLVSVDTVEQATGLDFFARLPDDIEERLERGVAGELWR